MTSAAKIDRIINVTRLNVSERVRDHWYQQPLSIIRILAQNFGLNLNIKVIYSATRRAEHVTVGGDNWLIYDQYMGQSMNLLNRIFIESQDDQPAYSYFHKVLAERLLEVGMLSEALHCAAYYHNSRTTLDAKLTNEVWRDFLTKTQERFHMYHELGHEVFANPKLLPVMRGHSETIMAEMIQKKSRTINEVITSMREAHPAAYHHQDLETAIDEIRYQYESGEESGFHNAARAALSDAQVREEVFCDIFAADIISNEALAAERDPVETLRAAYIGFYHLQAIEYIRRFPDLGDDRLNWEYDSVPELQVRSHCLREHLLFIYELYLRFTLKACEEVISAKIQAFNVQLMEDQKRYYESIFDHVMQITDSLRESGILSRYGQKAVGALTRTELGVDHNQDASVQEDTIRHVISIMTGWSGVPA